MVVFSSRTFIQIDIKILITESSFGRGFTLIAANDVSRDFDLTFLEKLGGRCGGKKISVRNCFFHLRSEVRNYELQALSESSINPRENL